MSHELPEHADYMEHALKLAARAWGQTHPNPMVGAVIVEAGRIVAEGWHRAAGQDHAEVAALKALGRPPGPGACLYVTLEPCSTSGRTGPCTQAIIDAGIRQVVVGAQDPNPAHAGRGLSLLRQAGVAVIDGVLAADCEDLNLIFNHWITRQQPLIAAKMALTLDGKFAAASGQARWVTGEAARADVMRWRRYFPAIAVGAETVLQDDPRLTARTGSETWCPVRLVFDRSLRTLKQASLPELYTDAHRERTVVVCHDDLPREDFARAERLGRQLWPLPRQGAYFDWAAFRRRCAEAGIIGVYVETGPQLATAMLEQALADYAFVYQAPKFLCDAASPGIGSMRHTQSMDAVVPLCDLRVQNFGNDRLLRGYLKKMDDWIVATGNAHKVEEFADLLQGCGCTLLSADACGGMPEVVEDGDSFAANAAIKARALRALAPADASILADDSGLEVDALDGAPGIYSARYAGASATDAENVAKLLAALRGLPCEKRSARFRCALCLIEPSGAEHYFDGTCEGSITESPAGQSGFGYDPVFQPEGHAHTFAELGASIKAGLSHRARAVDALRSFLHPDAQGGTRFPFKKVCQP